MTTPTEQKREVMTLCQETFSACMKAAIHCTNDLQIPADHPAISALMDCADACRSAMNFTNRNSQALRGSLQEVARSCENAARVASGLDGQAVSQCLKLCQACEGKVEELLESPWHVAV